MSDMPTGLIYFQQQTLNNACIKQNKYYLKIVYSQVFLNEGKNGHTVSH